VCAHVCLCACMTVFRKCSLPSMPLCSKLQPRTCAALFAGPSSSRDQNVNFQPHHCRSPTWLGTTYCCSLDFIPELHAHSFTDCQLCSQRLALVREAITLQYSIASLFYFYSSGKYSVKYFLLFGLPKSLTAYIYINNKHYFPMA